MIGSTVGSYRIVSTISVGGMGTVYRAEHALIGRAAAVKVLNPELSTSRDVVQRFFNEARATSTIKHPGIVEVFDFGYMPSGHAFLVMELLEGATLTARAKARGPMPEGEAALLLRGVCSALAAAHGKGIVHRDLKPDNIFVVPDAEHGERTKILDFGIAKLTDIGLATSATKTGAVMGTPTYMSPEQCKGTGHVDHRADLYSLGCIFFELVAGRPPFDALGAGELIGQHLFVEPPSASKFAPGLSRDAAALIASLLQKEPDARPQSALELHQRLSQIAVAAGWLAPGTDVGLRASMAQIPLRMQTSPPAHITPIPTNVPTTLSGTASEQIPKTAPRRRWVAVVAGVVVAGAIGVGVAMRGGGSGEQGASKPAAEPKSVVAPVQAPLPDRAPNPTEGNRSISGGSEATPEMTSARGSAASRPPAASRPAPIPEEIKPPEPAPVIEPPKPIVVKKPVVKTTKKPEVAKPVTKRPDAPGPIETDL